MKKFLYSICLAVWSVFGCTAGPASAEVTAVSTTAKTSTPSPLSTILNSYYQLSKALVAGDAKIASAKAKDLTAVFTEVKSANLQADQQKAWERYGKQLSATAGKISAASDIAKQRELFASLSDDMTAFTKAYGPEEEQTFYRMYCPMKKVYWLSDQKKIENPYYGKEMLSCGKITETIN